MSPSVPAIKSPVFQKWAVAVAVSSIIALLFSTNISLISRFYKVGDIAVMDVTASRDLVEQGIDIKKGEIVIRAGDRITEDAVKKLKVVADISHGRDFLILALAFFLSSLTFF